MNCSRQLLNVHANRSQVQFLHFTCPLELKYQAQLKKIRMHDHNPIKFVIHCCQVYRHLPAHDSPSSTLPIASSSKLNAPGVSFHAWYEYRTIKLASSKLPSLKWYVRPRRSSIVFPSHLWRAGHTCGFFSLTRRTRPRHWLRTCSRLASVTVA